MTFDPHHATIFTSEGESLEARLLKTCLTGFTKPVLQVLLVSSRSEPESWTVAGGGMEPNESGAVTSVREAREEVSE